VAHILHPDDPTLATLVQYIRISQPVHVLLFLAGMLVCLGLPAAYAIQRKQVGLVGFIGMLFLCLAILFGDMLHCVLEFSIFPVLAAQVHTEAQMNTLQHIVEQTYNASVLATLQQLAQPLLLLGLLLFSLVSIRARVFPRWPSLILLISLVLIVPTFIPTFITEWIQVLRPFALSYLGIAGFGFALLMERTVPQKK
jgi:hypothetical protein